MQNLNIKYIMGLSLLIDNIPMERPVEQLYIKNKNKIIQKCEVKKMYVRVNISFVRISLRLMT